MNFQFDPSWTGSYPRSDNRTTQQQPNSSISKQRPVTELYRTESTEHDRDLSADGSHTTDSGRGASDSGEQINNNSSAGEMGRPDVSNSRNGSIICSGSDNDLNNSTYHVNHRHDLSDGDVNMSNSEINTSKSQNPQQLQGIEINHHNSSYNQFQNHPGANNKTNLRTFNPCPPGENNAVKSSDVNHSQIEHVRPTNGILVPSGHHHRKNHRNVGNGVHFEDCPSDSAADGNYHQSLYQRDPIRSRTYYRDTPMFTNHRNQQGSSTTGRDRPGMYNRDNTGNDDDKSTFV